MSIVGKVFFGFLGTMILIGALGALLNAVDAPGTNSSQNGSPSPAPAAQAAANAALLAQCKSALDAFQPYGLVKSLTWNTGGSLTDYELVVDKSLWDTLPFTAKSGVAKAAGCEAVGGNRDAMVGGTIYDDLNHDEIGKLSSFDGNFVSEEPVAGQ